MMTRATSSYLNRPTRSEAQAVLETALALLRRMLAEIAAASARPIREERS